MIRLQRIGKRVQPSYRFVVSEKHKDTRANSLEILGHYQPKFNPAKIELKKDRIQYWLSKGAQCSATVNNILVDASLLQGKKEKTIYITKKRAEKMATESAGKTEEKK